MRKKLVCMLLAMTMAVGLAACGSGGGEAAAPQTDAPAAEAATEAETPADGETAETTGGDVTLTMWTWSPITRTAEKMIEAFENENPGIKIEYTNYNYNPEYLQALSAAAASDNLPDIIGLQPGSLTQTYADYLVDYSGYAEESWGADWKGNFDELTARQITLGNPAGDESCYILPIETQVINIEYNKTLFDELGIKKPATYEELKNCAQVLRDNGYAPLFFGGADGWQHVNLLIMCASQLDAGLFDACQNGEKPWTDAAMVKALENYKKLWDDGIIQDGALSSTSYSDGTNLFLAGQAGMMALGSWWAQEYTAEDVSDCVANWDYDYFYLPAISDGAQASRPIGGVDFGYGITQNCKNPEAAWKAISNFCAGSGAQAIVNDMNNHVSWAGIQPDEANVPDRPGRDAVIAEFNGTGADIASGLVNQRISEATIETAVQEACQALAGGSMSVEEAAAHIQAAQDAVK